MEKKRETLAFSGSVERAIDILEAISRHKEGQSNSELSRTLGIPKSSASYILRTLEQRGYLRKDAAGKYKLGFKFLILSRSALAGLDLKETALPVLRQLAEKTGFTANLAILDRMEVVYIEKAEASGFIKVDTWLGRRLPAHATSVGKALLAFLPLAEVETLLKGDTLDRRTPSTITSHGKLYRELDMVRREGYSLDNEESSPGVRCVGAPVFGSDGRVEAAISVSATITQIDQNNLRRTILQVTDAARKISQQLGYSR